MNQRTAQQRVVHAAVTYAVRRGELIKPSVCSSCGLEKRLYSHHDDYAKPLQVRWLCGKCHRTTHLKRGRGLNVGMAQAATTEAEAVVIKAWAKAMAYRRWEKATKAERAEAARVMVAARVAKRSGTVQAKRKTRRSSKS